MAHTVDEHVADAEASAARTDTDNARLWQRNLHGKAHNELP